MARPRNNIVRLPTEIRMRICELIENGETYDDIRADIEIKAACDERSIAIHNSSLGAYRSSAEFDEYVKMRKNWGEKLSRRRMAAVLVNSESGSDNIAKVANFELLNIVLEKLQGSEPLEAKEIRSISTAIAAFERNRISAAKDDSKAEFNRRESEYQAEIAKLSAKIAEISGVKELNKGLSPEALKKIEDAAGLL
ncbi:MAG: DUF3486 family protein [Lentisphaerae bacterium]|nr:DUF3486 family protein [Lentisphaerota bacterium]